MYRAVGRIESAPSPTTGPEMELAGWSIWEPEPGLLMIALRLQTEGMASAESNTATIESGSNSARRPGNASVKGWDFTLDGSGYRIVITKECRERRNRSPEIPGAMIPLSPSLARPAEDRLEFHEFTIDPNVRRVVVGGQIVPFTRREFDLLYFLAYHRRQIFTRCQLLDSIWGMDYFVCESTVTVHISRIRSKLRGVLAGMELIQTVRGIGYKFEPPVRIQPMTR